MISEEVVLTVIIFFVFIMIFFLVRNEWVSSTRMKVLWGEDGLKEYSRLPSYDKMTFMFWSWDVEKMKEKQNDK